MHNTPDHWLSFFPSPKPEGHKYDRGVALVYGGAHMTGAARLAVRAAQRIGAGLVVLASPDSAISIYAETLESVILLRTNNFPEWQSAVNAAKHTVILIGPGLGLDSEHKQYVLAALATGKPCVLDADALTIFADDPDQLFLKLHPHCILTPHEGEFQRLFGKQVDATAEKSMRAKHAAKMANCIVLLKGAETVIAAPDGQMIINNNAPPWLATAGSGDVLAGLTLGLMAQKMPIFWSAAAATWLHGDIANHFGVGMIAEDLVSGIPAALQRLLVSAVSTP